MRILPIITAKDENSKILRATMDSVRKLSCDMLIVDDGSRQPVYADWVMRSPASGVGPARDAGIRRAHTEGYSHVLLLDGHMRLDQSIIDALDAYCHQCDEDHDIACLRCDRLTDDFFFGDTRGYGARVKSVRATPTEKPGIIEYNLWELQWDNSQQAIDAYIAGQAREIGCLLGAAYIIPVTHYLDVLKAPWQTARGWGISEATISISQALTGHKCFCLPGRAGHYFATPERVEKGLVSNYSFSQTHFRHNQLRLGRAVMPERIDELLDYIRQSRSQKIPYEGHIKSAHLTAIADQWPAQIQEVTIKHAWKKYCRKWEVEQ
jgi:hypothetical protein